MSLPTVLRPCEGCANAVALVDGSTLVCKRIGRVRNVTFCKAYEKEDGDVFPDDVSGRLHPCTVSSGLEGRE